MRRLYLFAALLLLLPLAACDKHAADKRAIRTTWNDFLKANDEHNGAAAAALVSKSTIDHYTKLLKIGLDAPAKDCWNLPPTQMAEVLKMRNRFKRSELKSIDGKGYVLIKASRGWATDDDTSWKLTNIKVVEDRATADEYNPQWEDEYASQRNAWAFSRRYRFGPKPEKPSRYPLTFVKEGEAWKLDETSSHARLDKEIHELATATRMSVRDFLMEMEAFDTDSEKLSFSVWDPMKK